MRAQVVTYSRARGVFAAATLNGVAVKQDMDGTRIHQIVMTGYVTDKKQHELALEIVEPYAAHRRIVDKVIVLKNDET